MRLELPSFVGKGSNSQHNSQKHVATNVEKIVRMQEQ